jgi:pimeloyl-ACP methyl ester carboxylesterase
VVLVHGLGGSANGYWKVLRPLAQHFRRVWAVDLPGNGFSPGPCAGAHQQVEVLIGFLEQVVEEPALLIGCSLGGAMCITVAHRRPELVRALGLVAPAGAKVAQARVEALLRAFRVTTDTEARALTRRLFHRAPVGALLLAGDLRRVYSSPAVATILAEQQPGDALAPEVLASLQMPTLLLWGEGEKLLPYEGVEYFRAHLPSHAEVHIVPRTGHVLQLETPGQLVRHVVSFAARNDLLAPM